MFKIRRHQALARSRCAKSGVGAGKAQKLTGRFLQAHSRRWRVIGHKKVRLEIDARVDPAPVEIPRPVRVSASPLSIAYRSFYRPILKSSKGSS